MESSPALKRLGAMLRDLRRGEGVTGKQLAELVHYSQPTISRIESGAAGAIDWQTIATIAEALSLNEESTSSLRRQHELALLDPRSYVVVQSTGVSTWQEQFAAIESTTLLHRDFQNTVVPGLLQTPAYSQAVFSQLGLTKKDLHNSVTQRSLRQVILNDPRKKFVFVMMDCAIYSVRTTREDHLQQLDLVLSRATAANISVRVIDSRLTVPVSLSNPFVILDRKYVSAETTIKELTSTNRNEITLYEEAFNDALRHALLPDESSRFIRQAMTQIELRPE